MKPFTLLLIEVMQRGVCSVRPWLCYLGRVSKSTSIVTSPALCSRSTSSLIPSTPSLYDHTKSQYWCFRSSHSQVNQGWSHRTKLICATAGSCLFFGISLHTTALCKANNLPTNEGESFAALPSLTLYQYRTCPFCCKTRAYLDYKKIPYKVVEVNPLFRKEIKFSEYKKVPFIVTEDKVQINDSSLLISVLQTFIVNDGSENLSRTLDLYPEMKYTDKEGKEKTERANKYFIMYGENGESKGVSLAERREEREWREWVDDKLIHALSPNIYRTPSESLKSFDYISRVGNFGILERVAAKYFGAISMYFLSKLLKKKYKLKEDVRQSLYEFCNQWLEGIGKHRKFMGGSEPNLSDLAVYGVLSSIEGLSAFTDMMENTNIGPWYRSMKNLIHKTEN